ncbi:MAG: transcriptional repressor [Candidatus Omnitrophica bacterium]|nr:transcriptional repressor [Candidatus Omnitrophota bacterium]
METVDLLKKYNISSTFARRQIIRQAASFGQRHFSAEDILKKMRKKKSRVSRASTFRALNLFCQKGILEAIDLGKGFNLYELTDNSGHHDHLYCLGCGKILEFEDKTIEDLQVEVCRRKNFKVLKHTLKIIGLCQECKNG